MIKVLWVLCIFVSLAFIGGCSDDEATQNADGDIEITDGDREKSEVENQSEKEIEQEVESSENTEQIWWKSEWKLPKRDWQSCKTEHATTESLAEKAKYFQWMVPRLNRVSGKTEDGREIVHALFHGIDLDAPAPKKIVPDDQLPNILSLGGYGNAGLWTSHYVAAQAFRYATAKRDGDAEEMKDALSETKITLEAIYKLLRITGKSGLYARGYWSPLPIFTHPEPKVEHNNYHVTEGEFKDYSWHGDVSQDEYAGHMYALGTVARLVDDPDVQEVCRDIASQVGNHLKDNGLWIVDLDGKPTRFGTMNAHSMNHFPGYNAWQSLTWIKLGAEISGEKELDDYYHNCLLQEKGEVKCIEHDFEIPTPYTEHIKDLGIMNGCNTNYDSVSMSFLAAANLIWFEEDEDLRKQYQSVLHDQLMTGDPDGRNITKQANPLYNMIYAAMMNYNDSDDTAPEPLVKDAICTLMEFPAHQMQKASDTQTDYPHFCTGERHGSQAEEPVPWRIHKNDLFLWWGTPYKREIFVEKPTHLNTPADYLLPYWMGRYFGWISKDM